MRSKRPVKEGPSRNNTVQLHPRTCLCDLAAFSYAYHRTIKFFELVWKEEGRVEKPVAAALSAESAVVHPSQAW